MGQPGGLLIVHGWGHASACTSDGAESVVCAIRARGGRAMAVRADVAAPGDVVGMFARARQEMGPLAALVNNAGTTGDQARS